MFGETPSVGVLAGAFLVVGGGMAVAAERDRPAHVRRIGIAYALFGAALFAFRDNLVRHFALDTDVPSMTGGAASSPLGMAVTAVFVALRRERLRWPLPATGLRWLVPGVLVGFSFVALFEAYYRGEVSIVAPTVGTESLWGVGFSALLLHETERVGSRLVLGAALVVAGGVLIALTR